ncbi:hypothetical protein Bca52824_096884 [Brassica carinata]|uniref:Uncharacterized protein n=1 Tax=Brassica carinata TaxID=52824 RepID=A0A8X7TI20_BRACI|nr:hypothetical protein Bca52824_096884 [Brassica carinata]
MGFHGDGDLKHLGLERLSIGLSRFGPLVLSCTVSQRALLGSVWRRVVFATRLLGPVRGINGGVLSILSLSMMPAKDVADRLQELAAKHKVAVY